MRTPVVAGNWKMNLLQGDAVELILALRPRLEDVLGTEIVVFPPFTALSTVCEALRGTGFGLGGQNCYAEASGAFTGEVSAPMLADAGCEYVLVGHSERRQYFGETEEVLKRKIARAIEAGLRVIYCVGETRSERKEGQMRPVLERQVVDGLDGFEPGRFRQLILAYEPVWAIGTGDQAAPEQAEEAHAFIRELVAGQFGETIAQQLRIQYGGSVKPDNAGELMSQPNVDGALVGGASLRAKSFTSIVHAAQAN